MPCEADLSYFYRDEIYIETTNRCNIRCRFCENPVLRYPRGMMGLEDFRKAVDEIAAHPAVKAINLVGMGETFLNPRIWDMIDYVHAKGIPCYGCTNGKWRASEEQVASITKLQHIHITIDGTTNDVYQISRPHTDVDRIFDTVRQIIRARKRQESRTPHVQVRMNLFAFNRHQLFELIRVCREMGVDSVWIARGAAEPSFQTTLSDEEWARLPPDYVYTSGFERSSAAGVDRQTGLNGWRHKTATKSLLDEIGCNGVTIRWDGYVTPCCFDFNVTAALGNIRDESLKTLWSRPRVEAFEHELLERHRERVRSGRTIQCDVCAEFRRYLTRCQSVIDRVQPSTQVELDRLRLAAEHLQQGRLADSESILFAFLRECPHQPEALHLLGISAYRRGEIEMAEQLLGQALSSSTRLSSKLKQELEIIRARRQHPAAARPHHPAAETLPSGAVEGESLP